MRKPFVTRLSLALAVLLGAVWALRAQEAGDAASDEEEEAAAEAAPAPARPPGKAPRKPKTMGKDKAGIEAYLKHRLAAIKAAHKARVDFMAKDSQEWTGFWNKVKSERELFEVRVARQRLDLFESLGSLEQKEHPASIADFERLQAGVIRAFENQQRQKIADFFYNRDRRWKDFAAAQERERSDFAAEVETSWEQLKANLKLRGGSSRSSAPSRASYSEPSSRSSAPPARF